MLTSKYVNPVHVTGPNVPEPVNHMLRKPVVWILQYCVTWPSLIFQLRDPDIRHIDPSANAGFHFSHVRM